MKRLFVICGFMLLASISVADDTELYKQFKIEDEIKWIDETPTKPEDYIGQVWLITKNGDSMPYHTPIIVPIQTNDEPTVKKSVLIKANTNGSVSFLNIATIKGESESVFQFQIVDSKKFSANSRDPKYAKAISHFRNDPNSDSIFTENDKFSGIVMCTAVVQKKIWYKIYKKKSWGASGTYYVKIDGNDYFGTEDYEEIQKYGLLVRPIHGFGYKLPKLIVNSEQVEKLTNEMKIPDEALKKIIVKPIERKAHIDKNSERIKMKPHPIGESKKMND